MMIESPSELSVTAPMGNQLRGLLEQRAGFCSRARVYTAAGQPGWRDRLADFSLRLLKGRL